MALASHAAAQTVRGVVAEDGTGTRLAGAMVVLFDFDGEAVDRVLSDAGGGFTMRADHPGRYHVRVDRIGYASLTTDPFDVPVRGTFRRIDVPIRPIRVRGLDVSGSRRCEVRPEEGRVTARVWEEARKALEAAAWTQSTGIYRYTLRHFVRDLDRSGERILDENRAFKRGSTNAPFVSVPVEGLIADGFVQEDVESGTIYHAPDAEAFLSDAFIDTHCMGVRRGEAGSIGLVFEPVEGRTLPDIEGVLLSKFRGMHPSLARRRNRRTGPAGVFVRECLLEQRDRGARWVRELHTTTERDLDRAGVVDPHADHGCPPTRPLASTWVPGRGRHRVARRR